MKKIYKYLYFLIVISIFIYLGLYKIWHFLPQSTHQWRQTDSASFMLEYYNNGLNIFQPGIMNLMNGDQRTVAEFPIFYYLGAILSKLFFYTEGWLRLLNFIIYTLGFYYFYKWVYQELKSIILSLSITIICFTSPVLLYYSFNMLPDPTGFGFSILAISLIGINETIALNRFNKFLLVFSLSLAGMIKLPFLFLPIGYYFLSYFFLKSADKLLIKQVLLGLVFPVCWFFISKYYNGNHNSDYFLSRLMPIWQCDSEQISAIFNRIKTGWFFDYLSLSSWIILVTGLIFLIYQSITKFSNKLFIWIVSFFGSCSIFLLWFIQFEHHDYYLFFIYPFFMMTLFYASYFLINKFENSKLILIPLLIFSAFYQLSQAKEIIWNRYDLSSPFQKDCLSRVYHHVDEIQDWLNQIKVGKEDKILNISDGMTNGSLYFLRRHGWNQFNFRAHQQIVDKAGMDYFKSIGAKYLVFDEKRWLDTVWIKENIHYKEIARFKDSLFVLKL